MYVYEVSHWEGLCVVCKGICYALYYTVHHISLYWGTHHPCKGIYYALYYTIHYISLYCTPVRYAVYPWIVTVIQG